MATSSMDYSIVSSIRIHLMYVELMLLVSVRMARLMLMLMLIAMTRSLARAAARSWSQRISRLLR